jgi:tape measure domain-containing protein
MTYDVASASVALLPTFKGGAAAIEKALGQRNLAQAGSRAGTTYGSSFISSVSSVVGVRSLGIAATLGTTLFAGFNRFSAIDNAKAKLTSFGYTAEQVTGVLASANDAVLGTAYNLGDAATSAASSLAAGVQQGAELNRYLGLVVDAAAATNASLGDISLVFNQITAAGRLYTQDANQLVQRGIPVWKLLADQYGVTATELRSMVEQGQVDSKTFFDVIEKYIGGSAKKVDSFKASVSNFMASVGRTGANLLSGVLGEGKTTIKDATAALKAGEPVAQAFGDSLGGVVRQFNELPAPVKSSVVAIGAMLLLRKPLDGLNQSALGVVSSYKEQIRYQQVLATGTLGVDAKVSKLSLTMGALRTSVRGIGPAFLGAFGGPVGLAVSLGIAGLTAALGAWTEATARQKAATQALSDTLDQNTGAVTAETARTIAQALQDDGALAALKDLGFQTDDVVKKILAGGPAAAKLTAELQRAADAGNTASTNAILTGVAPNAAVSGIISRGELARKALDSINTQLVATTDAVSGINLVSEAIGQSGDAAAGATPQYESLSDAVKSAFGSFDAIAAKNSAIQALSKGIRENGRTLNAETAGGIANAAALEDALSAMAEAAGGDQAKFAGNVIGLVESLRAQGVDTSGVMAQVRAALENVAGKKWTVLLDGRQSIAEAKAIVKANLAAAKSALLLSGSSASDKVKFSQQISEYNKQIADLDKIQATASSVGSTFSSAAKSAASSISSGASAVKSAADLARRARNDIVKAAQSLVAKERQGSSEVQSVLDSITAAYSSSAISKKVRDALRRQAAAADRALQTVELQRTISAGYRSLGDLNKLASDTESAAKTFTRVGDTIFGSASGSAASTIAGLKNQLAQAKEFRAAYDALTALGLNQDSLSQLVNGFLSGGDASLAKALAAGGSSAIAEINSLEEQLGLEGSSLGKSAADELYKAGVQSVQGFLDGLSSQDAELIKKYQSIAKQLIATIKKELGIHSPARATAWLAEMTSRGWNENLHFNDVTPTVGADGSFPDWPKAAQPIYLQQNVTYEREQTDDERLNAALDLAKAGALV